MKPKPNPVHKAGTRNVYCPDYETCLDHAVELGWQYWSCSDCTYKLTQRSTSPVQTVNDPDQPYELPVRIHREVRYRFG